MKKSTLVLMAILIFGVSLSLASFGEKNEGFDDNFETGDLGGWTINGPHMTDISSLSPDGSSYSARIVIGVAFAGEKQLLYKTVNLPEADNPDTSHIYLHFWMKVGSGVPAGSGVVGDGWWLWHDGGFAFIDSSGVPEVLYSTGGGNGTLTLYQWEEHEIKIPVAYLGKTVDIGFYGVNSNGLNDHCCCIYLDNVSIRDERLPDPAFYGQEDIVFIPPTGFPGDVVTVEGLVHNIGEEDVTSCDVSFYYNQLDESHLIGTVFELSIPAIDSTECSVNWNTAGFDSTRYRIISLINNIYPENADIANDQAQKNYFLVNFDDDFESGSLSDWMVYGPQVAEISSETPDESSYSASIRIADRFPGEREMIYKTVTLPETSETSVLLLQFWMKVEPGDWGTSHNGGYAFIDDGSGYEILYWTGGGSGSGQSYPWEEHNIIIPGAYTGNTVDLGFYGVNSNGFLDHDCNIYVDNVSLKVLRYGAIGGNVDITDTEDDSGAVVTVVETGQSDTTDINGDYLIEDLLTGTYELIAVKEGGYVTQDTTGIVVEEADTTYVNFEINPLIGFSEDFETGDLAGWRILGPHWTGVSSNTPDGSVYSAFIEIGAGHAGQEQMLYKNVTLPDSGNLILNFWMKVEPGEWGDWHEGGHVFIDDGSGLVDIYATGGGEGYGREYPWEEYEINITSSYAGKTVNLGFYGINSNGLSNRACNIYVDNVSVYEATSFGSIAGNVTLVDTVDNSGVIVYVIGMNLSDTTDTNGNYLIENLPIGTYSLRAVKEEYVARDTAGIIVVGGDTTYLNFVLYPLGFEHFTDDFESGDLAGWTVTGPLRAEVSPDTPDNSIYSARIVIDKPFVSGTEKLYKMVTLPEEGNMVLRFWMQVIPIPAGYNHDGGFAFIDDGSGPVDLYSTGGCATYPWEEHIVNIPSSYAGETVELGFYGRNPTGYADENCAIYVDNVSLYREETGTIAGNVNFLDTGDNSGAIVIVQGFLELFVGITDINGDYMIEQVPVGIHELRVTKEGYISQDSTGVVVEEGQTTYVDFSLESLIPGFSDDFEGGDLAGWTIIGPYEVNLSSETPDTSNYSASIIVGAGVGGKGEYRELLYKTVTLPEDNNLMLHFWMKVDPGEWGTWHNGGHAFIDDGSGFVDLFATGGGEGTGQVYPWEEYFVNIPLSYAGQTVNLGFYGANSDAGLLDRSCVIYVDNVSICEATAFGSIAGNVDLTNTEDDSWALVYVVGWNLWDFTDENGDYLIEEPLPVGTYKLLATKDGYTPKDTTIVVVEGDTTYVYFTLSLGFEHFDDDFESGDLAGWMIEGNYQVDISGETPDNSNYSARIIMDYGQSDQREIMYKTVTLPENLSSTLYFWMKVTKNSQNSGRWHNGGHAFIDDGSGPFELYSTGGGRGYGQEYPWEEHEVPIPLCYAGKTVDLGFYGVAGTYIAGCYIYIDNVGLVSGEPAAFGAIAGNVDLTDTVNDSGAIVSIEGIPALLCDTTDINGDYIIPHVPIGNYQLKAEKWGYISQDTTGVIVTENGTTYVNFSLEPVDGIEIFTDNFEDGDINGWAITGPHPTDISSLYTPDGSDYSAYIDIRPAHAGERQMVYKTLTLPEADSDTSNIYLHFWMKVGCAPEMSASNYWSWHDGGHAFIDSSSGPVDLYSTGGGNGSGQLYSWEEHEIRIPVAYLGKTVNIGFYGVNSNGYGDHCCRIFIDNVSIRDKMLPDPALGGRRDITFEPSLGAPGDTVVIKAMIHNIGGADMASCDVSFYLNQVDESYLIGTVEGLSVSANDSVQACIDWNTAGLDSTRHRIIVTITNISQEDADIVNNLAQENCFLVPFDDNFESGELSDWVIYGPPERISISSDTPDTSRYSARIHITPYSFTEPAAFYKTLTIPDTAATILDFWMKVALGSWGDNHEGGYAFIDDGSGSQIIYWTGGGNGTGQSYPWERHTVVIPASYAGKTVDLGFYGINSGMQYLDRDCDIYVDNVSFYTTGLGAIGGNVNMVGIDDNSGVIVTVMETGFSDTTDISGDYLISPLVPGNYVLRVTPPIWGYPPQEITGVEVTEYDTTYVNFIIEPALPTPTNLTALSGYSFVPLSWSPPSLIEELYFDDGSFEGAITGEMDNACASRMTPEFYPCRVQSILFSVANYGVPAMPIRVYILDDGGGVPGNPIDGPYDITPPGPIWCSVDVSDASIQINTGDFYIAVEYQTNNNPWIEFDYGPPTYGRAWWGEIDGDWTHMEEYGPNYYFNMSFRALVIYSGVNIQKSTVQKNILQVFDDKQILQVKEKISETKPVIINISSPDIMIFYPGRDNKIGGEKWHLGYNIYRSNQSGGPYDYLAYVAIPETSYNDSLVIGDSTYWYVVTALYDEGESDYSNETNGTPTGVSIDEILLPKVFSLSQNRPNPFFLETNIRYNLPRKSHVTLKIYNIKGRLIRNLIDDTEEPGYKSICWDGKNDQGKDVPNGLYLYKMQAGDYISTKKLIILR